jgi:hypothetical protein
MSRMIYRPHILNKQLPKQTAPPRAGFVIQSPVHWVYVCWYVESRVLKLGRCDSRNPICYRRMNKRRLNSLSAFVLTHPVGQSYGQSEKRPSLTGFSM